MAESLAQKLARSISIAQDDIDCDQPLFAYVVDSLVAVELRKWIGKELAADVLVFDTMGGATIMDVSVMTVRNSSVGK